MKTKQTHQPMSIPEYEAISFQKILEKGGHSKPWLVLINVNDKLKQFVVKLYKTDEIESRNKMTAEIMGNVLAREFGLNTPEPAIINFTNEFRMQLNYECEKVLSIVDERPKFGCEFVEGAIQYNYNLERSLTNSLIEPALVYAFDYFICNRDRNYTKPNLLIKNHEAYLIDHEMGLEITEETTSDFLHGIWDKRYQYHLFYNFLKDTRNNKNSLFDEFLLYLNNLSLQKFVPYFEQLEGLGFYTHKEIIFKHWETIKQNSNKFEAILKQSVQ